MCLCRDGAKLIFAPFRIPTLSEHKVSYKRVSLLFTLYLCLVLFRIDITFRWLSVKPLINDFIKENENTSREQQTFQILQKLNQVKFIQKKF